MRKAAEVTISSEKNIYRIELHTDADGIDGVKALKVRDVVIDADEITWLIDKIQPSRLTFDTLTDDIDFFVALSSSKTISKVYRNAENTPMWAGWMDNEGIELPIKGNEREFVTLSFGDFNPLKQRRFKRRGILEIAQIVNEAFSELGIGADKARYNLEVDTNILEYDATYYDAIELCCEALICTATQVSGAIELVNPSDNLAGSSVIIDNYRGEHNSKATSKVINSIEFVLKDPPEIGKTISIASEITPSSTLTQEVKDKEGKARIVRWGASMPSKYETGFDTIDAQVLSVKFDDDTAYRNSLSISPVIDMSRSEAATATAPLSGKTGVIERLSSGALVDRTNYKRNDVIASFETLITTDRDSKTPLRLKIQTIGGLLEKHYLVFGDGKIVEKGADFTPVAVLTCGVDILDDGGNIKYSLGNVMGTPFGTFDAQEVVGYKWDSLASSASIFIPAAGVGRHVGSNFYDAFLTVKPDGYEDGIALPPIPTDIKFAKIRVRVYSGLEYVFCRFAPDPRGGVIYTLLPNSTFTMSRIIITEVAQLKYYVGLESIGITQRRQKQPTEVVSYLDISTSEVAKYDSRILDGVAGVSTYTKGVQNTTPPQYLRLFSTLYRMYGVRGWRHTVGARFTGLRNYFKLDKSGSAYVQCGYSIDLVNNRIRVTLQPTNTDTYNGKRI